MLLNSSVEFGQISKTKSNIEDWSVYGLGGHFIHPLLILDVVVWLLFSVLSFVMTFQNDQRPNLKPNNYEIVCRNQSIVNILLLYIYINCMCKRFTASSFLNLTSRTFDLFRILELSKYLVRKYLHSEMQNVLISEPHDKDVWDQESSPRAHRVCKSERFFDQPFFFPNMFCCTHWWPKLYGMKDNR